MAFLHLPQRWYRQPTGPVTARDDVIFWQSGLNSSHGRMGLYNGATREVLSAGDGIRNENYLDSYSSVTATLNTGAMTQGSFIVLCYLYGLPSSSGQYPRLFIENSDAVANRGIFVLLSRDDVGYGGTVFDFSRVGTTLQSLKSTPLSISAGLHLFSASFVDTTHAGVSLYRNGVALSRLEAYRTDGAGLYSDGKFVNIGGQAGASRALNGTIFLTAILNRALTPQEHSDLARDPWQLFKPVNRVIYFPVSGTTSRRRHPLFLLP